MPIFMRSSKCPKNLLRIVFFFQKCFAEGIFFLKVKKIWAKYFFEARRESHATCIKSPARRAYRHVVHISILGCQLRSMRVAVERNVAQPLIFSKLNVISLFRSLSLLEFSYCCLQSFYLVDGTREGTWCDSDGAVMVQC